MTDGRSNPPRPIPPSKTGASPGTALFPTEFEGPQGPSLPFSRRPEQRNNYYINKKYGPDFPYGIYCFFRWMGKRRLKQTQKLKGKMKRRTRRKREIERIKSYKSWHGCSICGRRYAPPCCYEGHHLLKTSKKENPTEYRTLPRYQAELSKGFLLCALCHRIVTIYSYNYARALHLIEETKRALVNFEIQSRGG